MCEMRLWNTIERVVVVAALIIGILAPCSAQNVGQTSGPFAYVTNQNSGTVTVIDTSTNTVVTNVSLCGECAAPRPKGVAVTPNGKFVFVANSGNGTVSVIDTSTNSVSKTISLSLFCDCTSIPLGVAITPDGTRAYVTDAGGTGAIYVINTSTYAVMAVDPGDVVSPTGAITISSDGLAAYYTFGGDACCVGRIDTNPNDESYNTHTTTISSPGFPVNDPTGLAITPDSSLLYITNKGNGTVAVITTGLSPVSVKTVTVGSGPYSVAITPNGQSAYVVNQTDATVSVINTATYGVTTPISLTCIFTPYQIAITLDGTEAWVADADCSSADVITTATNALARVPLPVESGPFGVAIGPTATTGLLPVSPGQSTNFIDGTIINQKVTIPSDANMNGVAFMQLNFILVPPAVFNSTRLTGVLGNAWSGGDQGPFTSPPSDCTKIAGTGGSCIVMQAKCFGGTIQTPVPLDKCTITASTKPITLTSSYKTDFPQPTPGFLIADDNQNNFANILIAFNANAFNLNDPIITGGTKQCQMDTVIVNLGGPVTPTPPSVNFGNVPVFGFPIRVVTVKNTGNAPLSITSANVAPLPGQDSDDFFALSFCLRPLLPTKSCFILVGFFADPDDFSPQSATLNITNNAPGSPQLIVPLSATVVKSE